MKTKIWKRIRFNHQSHELKVQQGKELEALEIFHHRKILNFSNVNGIFETMVVRPLKIIPKLPFLKW